MTRNIARSLLNSRWSATKKREAVSKTSRSSLELPRPAKYSKGSRHSRTLRLVLRTHPRSCHFMNQRCRDARGLTGAFPGDTLSATLSAIFVENRRNSTKFPTKGPKLLVLGQALMLDRILNCPTVL